MKKCATLVLILFGFLAFRVSGQSILKDNKIPKDLVITLGLSSTIQFSSQYIYKITSDGNVYFEDYSTNLPSTTNFSSLLRLNSGKDNPVKIKKLELKDKLSKKQIKQLIFEFEKSGFFEMNESNYGDTTLKEGGCVDHANTKGLSLSANGETKNVAFFLGCSYGENSPLKSFLELYSKVEKELRGVKKVKLERSSSDKNKILTNK